MSDGPPSQIDRVLVLLLLILVASGRSAGAAAPLVEPATLVHRTDLLGREVAVDDRVRFFQSHKDRGYDEIRLKRTPVIFRLPPRLRFELAPRAAGIRIEGILGREGDQWFCDVTDLELLPNDLERLDRAVSQLAPEDAERRTAWARWAERRGGDFKDQALLDRARALETEALRIEAERPSKDPPRRWLELARRAREHKLSEPEPSALAHRALAARLGATETVAAAESLLKEIEELLPASRTPAGGKGVENADLDAWSTPYARDPAAAYRAAPEPVRAALDRRLWADATLRRAELQMKAEPERALEHAQTAAASLPDRPVPVAQLLEQGLAVATQNVTALRQADVEALARVARDDLHRPEAADSLIRRWLNDQRDHRLSATDAEGRVLLARQYDALLKDGGREAAVALLQDAWRIDPQSREVADAFRRWGFRKRDDRWIEPAHGDGSSSPDTAADPASASASGNPALAPSTSLLGLTPRQVRLRLGGKPDRVVWSASRGQVIEQWIYHGVNRNQYFNFLHTPGEPLPKVVAYYARPRLTSDPGRPR